MWWGRICSLVGVLTAPLAASAVEILADDVPIPADTRIVSAPPETPEAAKRFLGAWVGSWGGLLHQVLIVESVDSDGVASVVYAVGDNPRASVSAPVEAVRSYCFGGRVDGHRCVHDYLSIDLFRQACGHLS